MPKRFESLDGLRGIAAIGVVLFHIRWPNHVTETHFIRESYLFVDLFFILSGFIIAKAYGNQIRTAHQAATFLILRFFRIYPLHFAVLLVFILYELVKVSAVYFGFTVRPFQESGWTLISNLFLVESLTFSGYPTWNVPSWSISCEAVAYVVFATAAVAGVVNMRHFARWALIFAIVLYSIVLYYKGSLFALIDLGLIRCLAGFCVGAAISTVPEKTLVKLPVVIYNVAPALLIIATTTILSFLEGLSNILVVPMFALIVLLLQTDRGLSARVLKSKLVAFLGRTSYSIYMVHWFILGLAIAVLKYTGKASYSGGHLEMYKVNPLWGDLGVAMFLTLVVAVAAITYRKIEAPWRSYGRALAMQTWHSATEGRTCCAADGGASRGLA